ncbi:MAG: hypothetical protein KDB03_02390 [Planctomycetales bacterium]|nr:hypothetical protein [Planctomycetales bacterium]
MLHTSDIVRQTIGVVALDSERSEESKATVAGGSTSKTNSIRDFQKSASAAQHGFGGTRAWDSLLWFDPNVAA